MKVALDIKVLAYAEGTNGAAMRDKALELIQRLPPGAIVLPVQTLGELFKVLVRKARRRPAHARAAVLSWRDAYPVAETSATVIVNAMDLASIHGLTIWDSVVLGASRKPNVACFCRRISRRGLRGVESQSPTRLRQHSTHCWRRCSRRSRSNLQPWGRSLSIGKDG